MNQTMKEADLNRRCVKWLRLRIRSIDNSTEWNQTFGTLKPARFHPRQPVEPGVSQVAANQFAVQLSPFETSNPLNQELNQEPGNRLAGGYFRDDQATSPIVRLAGGDSGRSMASGSINPASVDLRWEFHPAVLSPTSRGTKKHARWSVIE